MTKIHSMSIISLPEVISFEVERSGIQTLGEISNA